MFGRKLSESDVVLVLRRAFVKILMAERMLRDKRLKVRLTIVTAMAGLPLPGEFLGGVYRADAYGEIKRAIRIIDKLIKSRSGEDRVRLESAKKVLEEVGKDSTTAELRDAITRALTLIEGGSL